jgi:signal transduction histidine kinase
MNVTYPKNQPPPIKADTGIKVLLVDDNENNLLSMEVVLEKGGYIFFRATSGQEALRILLREEDFSLILLDVKMPIMDGYETAELIYQRDKLKHIPIIFITAHDYEEAAVFKGYQAGAVDFIRKPFNPEILRSKVAVFSELHKKTQLLRKQEEKLQIINQDLTLLNQDLEKRVLERTLDLENLNHELKALNLSKDKFLSVISHDLRNPLSSLILASSYLKDNMERTSAEEIRNLSDMIHKTLKEMLHQLDELIEFSKKQLKKSVLNPERLQMAGCVDEAWTLLKTNATQKSIALENGVTGDVHVRADSIMLRSILQNLMINAIKYTPEGGGPVEIRAEPMDSMVELFVQDHGTGMSDQTKELVLGNFSHSSKLGTNLEKGTGLGLLLVRDFIAQHGGTLSLESELGKGTCFRFTLPAN